MKDKRLPIFYDRTGKRSRAVYLAIIAIFITALTAAFVYIPPVLSAEQAINVRPPTAKDDDTVNAIASYADNNNIPVIGAGSFVRAVNIIKDKTGALTAQDPFTGENYGKLSTTDAIASAGYTYALQKFGQENKKRLAITYDDGPDPIYTPKILDALSAQSVPATFFEIGINIAQNEEITKRIAREGHTLANHSFSHINFDLENAFRGKEEIIQTGRLIRSITGYSTRFFRTPYAGDSDQAIRNDAYDIALAQELGYIQVYFNSDSNDWKFATQQITPAYPDFSGKADIVVLLHDGGGDRDKTVAYTNTLIQKARASGYTFTTVSELAKPYVKDAYVKTAPDSNDMLAYSVILGAYTLPKRIIIGLFVFSLVMIFLTTMLNSIFAWFNMHKPQLPIKGRRFRKYQPRVGVIVPAYNEGVVLEKTIQSLRASSYKNIEIVMIDDGSSDDTWAVMQRIVRRYKKDVRAIHQENTGKSGALNNAIKQVECELVICLDADTIFEKYAIAHLIKHFADPTIGAVAGVVKVGNASNYITRWQALEYTIGTMLERNAQSLLNAVTIVPGACGAWRRQAVLDAGGFSHRTLAEDCDLTYMIHRLGYRVIQENNARAYTEAPLTLRTLMKQRFRWTFGSIQALWINGHMMFDAKYKMLSNFVMPMTAIALITPLIFWPIVTFITIQNIVNGNYLTIVIFFAASLAVQTIFATIAIKFAGESFKLLFTLPIARFVFSPIRTYILYRSALTVFTGKYVGWNKLIRTGTVTLPSQARINT